jgi:hypothetical protein
VSSPVHHASDLDPALRYAPPSVRHRNQAEPAPTRVSTPVERPQRSQRLGNDRPFSGDRAFLELQRQLALDPDSDPEPPLKLADDPTAWRIVRPIFGAAGIAAIAAWAIVSLPGAGLLGNEPVRAHPSIKPISTNVGRQDRLRTAMATEADQPDTKPGGGKAVAQESGNRALLYVAAGAAAAAEPTPRVRVQEPPPAAPMDAGLITRRLDRDEVAALVKRGEDFMMSGEIASARLVLRRAAEAGDVRAALALAGTFDAIPLAKLGLERAADAAMARLWYERAKQFGSAEASQRLQQLANTVP